jgi:2-polyprenyl-6-methoxyphenol hydroxylase-like FAD-dependent oxidoreductase
VTRNIDPVLVVGGGLGGASISRALARKGIRVRHVEVVEREVMRQSASARSEQDVFDCVAWLYDGFPMPAQKGTAA